MQKNTETMSPHGEGGGGWDSMCMQTATGDGRPSREGERDWLRARLVLTTTDGVPSRRDAESETFAPLNRSVAYSWYSAGWGFFGVEKVEPLTYKQPVACGLTYSVAKGCWPFDEKNPKNSCILASRPKGCLLIAVAYRWLWVLVLT